MQVHLPIDQTSQAPKGIAYVSFETLSDAINAFRSTDGQPFQGRLLHVMPALERAGQSEPQQAPRPTTFKNRRQGERTKRAGETFQWASLFLNVCRLLCPGVRAH